MDSGKENGDDEEDDVNIGMLNLVKLIILSIKGICSIFSSRFGFRYQSINVCTLKTGQLLNYTKYCLLYFLIINFFISYFIKILCRPTN